MVIAMDRSVEEVLYAHEEVFEAAFFGIPHDDLGEEIAATEKAGS